MKWMITEAFELLNTHLEFCHRKGCEAGKCALEISSSRTESKTWGSTVCVCSLCLVDVKIRDDKSLLFRTWKESVRGARRARADGNAKWGAERRLIQLRWLRKVVSFARNWRRSRSIGHFASLIIGVDTAWRGREKRGRGRHYIAP